MSQAVFLDALMDAEQPVPEGMISPKGRPAGKRFDVYRNNVAVSLTEALESGFPVVRKLVGDGFFKAMAGVFLRAHPPTSPVLALYGDDFPGFLESFPPVSGLPYLPDITRLEMALRRAYHAADADPIDATALTALPAARLVAVRLALAPALWVYSSPWPIHSIWRANADPDAPKPGSDAETVLVTRRGFDPEVHPVGNADALFIRSLFDNMTLGSALDAATAQDPDFDLSAILGLLLAQGAITTILEGHKND